jgi:hypothetical protein
VPLRSAPKTIIGRDFEVHASFMIEWANNNQIDPHKMRNFDFLSV